MLAGTQPVHLTTATLTKCANPPTDGLGNPKRRMDALAAQPACQRGVAVPAPIPDLAKDPKATEEFAKNDRTILQR